MEVILSCICVLCAMAVCLAAGAVLRVCLTREQTRQQLPLSEEEQEAARVAAEAQRVYEQGFIDMRRYTGFEKKDGERW